MDWKVKADWFSGGIVSPQGKLVHYIHMGYNSIYENELELTFQKGKLVKEQWYHNYMSEGSVYSKDPDKLKQFLYSHIDWNKIPDLKQQQICMYVVFTTDGKGRLDSVSVAKGYNVQVDKEAARVAKMLPEWQVVYRRGKFEPWLWTIPIALSESIRKQYMKKTKLPKEAHIK
ncbi:hypothetical protein QNI19_07285 [Cytophagaceae bacterium DM2B3-1]|uniref:TonB C-terminal domain-containing protein n=1 Tax=Xanthocytophaga flava TaxID=3048013 RepID=A0ABT7CJ70_9BACT|nr:hypothetical protein [Xanthocytophaga flavus]MDJ1492729.1 hypothetical protein [Xanthocytophaga flavus]